MPNPTKKRSSATCGVTHAGMGNGEKPNIHLMDYKGATLTEKDVENVDDCLPFKVAPTVTWVNVTGIHNAEIVDKIGKAFELHPLILEDIKNTGQRPKVEDTGKYIFISLKMLHAGEGGKIMEQQASIILGTTFLVSFQECELGVFEPVRERIRTGKGLIRDRASDYLAYALIDAIVDNYFSILEEIGERMNTLEEALLKNPTQKILNDIHMLRRELAFMHKSVWPLREMLSKMQRDESKIISKSAEPYFRDVYNHIIEIIDTMESFREMASSMVEVYLSSVSNKLNEVMKVLTIIATIFIPLTFIVGIYGMNFKYMPELDQPLAYPLLWGVMITVGLSMFFYFKKKKWI